VKALILAPFYPQALDRLRTKIEVIYESWMDTRRLLSPEELIKRIQSHDLQIVVVEADFIFVRFLRLIDSALLEFAVAR